MSQTARIAPERYVRQRRARRAPALVLASATVLLALAGLGMLGAQALLAPPTPTGGAPATSTPASSWRKGELPHLYQTDPAWASEPYAGGTIEKNGCGPTCLSMVYVALTGKADLGPREMAAYAERGGYVQDGMTAWALMAEGASGLGLSSEELPADADRVREALLAGRPVICSVRPGDFTTTGHFVVLAGIDADGQVVVRDPNSAERSGRTWDLQRVLDQCANLWAYDA